MRALRFDKDLYFGTAIDEAVGVFRRFAEFELVEEPDAWVVKVEHRDPKRVRRVAGELSNYALGLTIRKRNEASSEDEGAAQEESHG
ncbi:MAG: HxsD-like protein [Myxococcota bacterium]